MRGKPWIIALSLPLLTCGCVTNALWNKTQLDDCNLPANNPHLRLFDASRQKDFLVVYDEYSERHSSIRPRAYFLNQNQKQVTKGQRPQFVSPRLSDKLPPLPVFQSPVAFGTNSPPATYAVLSTNQQSVAIFSSNGKSDYNLPVYNDGQGQIDRIALTPIAVGADATIIGGVIGCYFIYGMAQSEYTIPAR